MDFRIKCAIQHAFSVIPGGNWLNYFMQRHVTKAYPISEFHLNEHRSVAERHLANYSLVSSGLPRTVFEFGSGWHLPVPIILGKKGCKVIASDIKRLATDYLMQDMFKRLGARSLEECNVEYRVPIDARQTGLHDGTVDLIISNSVLEHVPADYLEEIFAECRRILSPNGVFSLYIDYRDHWSFFDKSLPHNHFLRYSDAAWPIYNPSIHYQNRLRHSEYVAIIDRSGLAAVAVEPVRQEPPSFPVARRFSSYSEEDLRTAGSWFVLTKRSH